MGFDVDIGPLFQTPAEVVRQVRLTQLPDFTHFGSIHCAGGVGGDVPTPFQGL
jgi:hypothetical protein